MAPQIAGVATLAFALPVTLYLAICWIIAKMRRTRLQFEVTKSGKTAVLVEGLALSIGVVLLLMRDLPSGLVVPFFWLLFPIMVLVALGAIVIGGRDMRSLYRAMNAFALGAGTITLIAIAVWILLPRFLYG